VLRDRHSARSGIRRILALSFAACDHRCMISVKPSISPLAVRDFADGSTRILSVSVTPPCDAHVHGLIRIILQRPGVAVRQEFKRFTAAHSAGTLVVPVPCDSANPAIPAGVTVRTGATVTDLTLLFPLTFANDEVGATQAFPSVQLQAGINWLPEGSEVQEVRLREGEGVTVKNITSTVIGSFAYMFVFTLDDL